MTEIPDDIMRAADSVLEHAQMSAGWNPLVQRGLIARALMAERAKWEAELATLRAENERLEDKAEGLDADLQSALEVIFNRCGPIDWLRMNYPGFNEKMIARAALKGGE
ncbi:hypothetical protein [Sphingomonas daechungensis]|uniref:hypothetical protein n=1 Tax=Sphingomonas daechungensis TaxID=1176646 RepID=UPI003784A9FE